MGQVNILVAVNVSKAIITKDLGKYVWLIDTNDYAGTDNTTEGTNELHTKVRNGDTIVWTVVPIDPNTKVAIHSFSSNNDGNHPPAIPEMINPAPYPQFDGSVWGGRVNKEETDAQYLMELLLEGNVHLSFDPYITSKNPSL